MNPKPDQPNVEQPIVLASGSPRRRDLLTEAGCSFRVIVPDDSVEEAVDKNLRPIEFVVEAAFQKARSVAAQLENEIVVGADTIAECNGQIIGKPRDKDHAAEILKTMSGTRHAVHTGLCLWNCSNGKFSKTATTSILDMDALSEQWLQEYLDSGLWQGKAGAFGYQDGLDWIRIVEGLESNVVGLPVEELPKLIAELLAK